VAAHHAITGAFVVGYGFFSVKIKQVWYLGEACEFAITKYCERQLIY
jgi:hypothetical protein